MSASARLKYKIVKCTSEDPEYPASELLAHSSQTKGWQTARFCDFPQEIGVQFDTPVHLRQVQFLSHQSKIATKIELFTGMPVQGQDTRYEASQFKRLGYLSLDSNERSQFQARELKSVYVDVQALYLRIIFHKCHVNRYNIVNQVGLIALNCLGEGLGPDLAVGPPPPNPALARGGAPAAEIPPAVASRARQPEQDPQEAAQAAADEMRFDGRTLERIRALNTAKVRAVEAEDYEEAKRCKEMLARLRQTGILLRELEDRKKGAVQNEDYDAAKALKVEIDRLRMAIERPQDMQAGPGLSANGSRATLAEQQNEVQNVQQMSAPRGGHQPVMAPAPLPFGGPEPGAMHREPSGGREDLFGPPDSDEPPFAAAAAAPPPYYEEPTPAVPAPAPFNAARLGSPPLPAHGANGGARLGRSPSGDAGGPGASFGPGAVASSSPAGAGPYPGRADQGYSEERERPDAYDGADGKDHPLSGVPNCEDLPEPEQLAAAVEKEAESLVTLFGDHITRCIFSKTWSLRDAALQKMCLEFEAGAYDGTDATRLLGDFAAVLRRTIPDKNVQVCLSAMNLLQAICRRLLGTNGPVRRQEAQSALEPLMPMLVERIGDANTRVDHAARDAHVDFARCPSVGASFASQHPLRTTKKKLPPRVYTSRLKVLIDLVAEAGVQPDSREGLDLDKIMVIVMDWFGNPSAEVREHAVKLAGSCYALVGLGRIEKYLANLRQTQRDVFDAEFEKISNGEGGGAADATNVGGRGTGGRAGDGGLPSPQVPPPRRAAGEQAPQQQAAEPEEDAQDETTCQFCGRQDPSWTAETQDVHYWKDCVMLMQCDYCQQVIEIATLQSHLEEECESDDPQRAAAARNLHPSRCHLCNADVGAGEDSDWRNHLVCGAGCSGNPRNAHRPKGGQR